MAVPAEASDAHRGTRSTRLAARRAELLDAAVRVIRRQGDAVAMETIAAEAGISRPILYRHFGDATGIYAAVAHRFHEELSDQLTTPTGLTGRALLHRQVAAFLDFVAKDPNVYRFLVRHAPPRTEPGTRRRGFSLLVANRTAGYLESAGWDAATALVAADLLVGGLEAAADRWLNEPVGTPAEVADTVTDLLWGGFASIGQKVGQAGAKRIMSAKLPE
jgi:AcrR family transcriptional regulator